MRRSAAGTRTAALPTASSPRLTLPAGPSSSAVAALHLYQPVTPRGTVAWYLALVLGRTGLVAHLAPTAQHPPQVIAALAPYLRDDDDLAVARLRSDGRWVALVLDPSGGTRAVAKIATTTVGKEALEYEATAAAQVAGTLPGPLRSPAVLAVGDGVVLSQAVAWSPRWRPWYLSAELAGALGGFWRNGASSSATGRSGPSHGDFAPWNLLRSGRTWYLIDWEHASTSPPFFDLAHYFVQSHVLLGRPRARALVDGVVHGSGWVGRALEAYAQHAGVPRAEAADHVIEYLRWSASGACPSVQGETAARVRISLLSALAQAQQQRAGGAP